MDAERAQTAGDLAGAERSLRAALSAFDLLEDWHGTAQVLAGLADIQVQQGDFGAATELHRQAVARIPGDVRALTGLGYAQWLGGAPADAEVTFSQALRRDRRAVRALTGRGQIRADLGDSALALHDLDEVLVLGPEPEAELDVRSARALALAGLERFDEAEAEIAGVLEADSGRVRTRLRAARIAALAGRTGHASSELREVLRLEPDPVDEDTARRLLGRLGG